MKQIAPRPVLLVLTLLLIVGAISFVELRFETADTSGTRAQAQPPPAEQVGAGSTAEGSGGPMANPSRAAGPRTTQAKAPEQAARERSAEQEQAAREVSDRERVESKEGRYPRAHEIVGPTGLINTDGVSLTRARGKEVVLLEFWTYSCYNCQNAQPYITSWYEKYGDKGLLVIGVHKPEFEFEKDYANVQEAVRRAGIQYPVVLDNNDATWNAYNNRYWPAWYLIDVDGFVRYKHFGEGAYEETEAKIQELLAERDRALNP